MAHTAKEYYLLHGKKETKAAMMRRLRESSEDISAVSNGRHRYSYSGKLR